MGVARVNFASFRSRVAARYVAALLVGSLVATPAASALAQAPGGPPARVDPTEARTQLIAADAAARHKDWASALDHYTQSNFAMPTALGLAGVANAQYQLGKLPEAYASYEELAKTYAGKLSRAQREKILGQRRDERNDAAGQAGEGEREKELDGPAQPERHALPAMPVQAQTAVPSPA